MLSRLRALKARRRGVVADVGGVNYTAEHVGLAKTIRRRKRILNTVSDKLPLVRTILLVVGVVWLLALPYGGLWKNTYIDEHALSPGQVTMYYSWSDVHAADRYLADLERLESSSQEERSSYIKTTFLDAGVDSDNTSTATWGHVRPPRSSGTETILLSASWVSREGGPNLRGIAALLSLGAFLRGQNHWAFDFVLVVSEGYTEGLEGFMQEYHKLFPGLIWTAMNLDYPGHSFDHIGVFYEGVNGRLPNQDVLNTFSRVASWSTGVPTRLHDIEDSPGRHEPQWLNHLPAFVDGYALDKVKRHLGTYFLGATYLWEHARYAAFGRASGAHGVLAKHRIDSLTLYCPNASGPHGFHSLGRTVESTLRSYNNLLERLHASYFFYLLPRADKFIPVGNYLPAAIILGASLTLQGFDCPTPIEGLMWLLIPVAMSIIAYLTQTPALGISLGMLIASNIKPKGTSRRSLVSFAYLFYGALIPTLAMVNFPQAILLATLSTILLSTNEWIRLAGYLFSIGVLAPVSVSKLVTGHGESIASQVFGSDLKVEWEQLGNITWIGILLVWVPLTSISALL